ncbi:MAG: amino acid ABC transporter permease [Deltaproteobacteria bacterium]|jgi:L-cystine transport system permease protein|nr:amino acid ABC transporter permease [Deltaproteobacteria bacterium]
MPIDLLFLGLALWRILPAVPMTLLITFLALALGFSLAFCLAYARYYEIPGLRVLAGAYVSFFRGTPVMMHFFLVYYGFPHLAAFLNSFGGVAFKASSVPLWALAVLALSLSAAAYFAEILRAGILAVARGEIEAAQAMGMTRRQVMSRIILPQALSLSVPNLGSRCIAVMHGSSLAFWIAVVEITAKANLVAAYTYQFMEAFLAAAVLYWLLTLIIERIVAAVERWNSKALGRGLRSV